MAKKRFEDDNTEIDNTAIYENLLDARFTLLWRHDGQKHRTAALTRNAERKAREDGRELFKG